MGENIDGRFDVVRRYDCVNSGQAANAMGQFIGTSCPSRLPRDVDARSIA